MNAKKHAGLDFSTFLASSIHEIKNALNGVLAATEELETEIPGSSAKGRDLLTHIKGDVSAINGDIIRILSLYRLHQDQYSLQVDEHNLRDFVAEVSVRHESLIARHKLQLNTELEEDLNGYFDEALISLVVATALNNACRYAHKEITLRGFHDKDYLCLEIEDDGPGFPDELLSQQNRHQVLSPGEGNTGLGLYFARQAAVRHRNGDRQGSIQVGNRPDGGGACFRLFLP